MNNVKFIFLGTTKFSEEILLSLIQNKYIPLAVFTLPEMFDISYSKGKKVKNYNYSSLDEICNIHDIPLYLLDSKNKITDYEKLYASLSLDVILVIGWYHMVPKIIRNHAKLGAWGIHASLLPNYAGGAPLVWAIINGENKTGVTLFKLDDGVDDGDIIDQKTITIDHEDTIKEVYDKATNVSKSILINALNKIPLINFTPQKKQKVKIYPQRNPEDGEIDLSLPSSQLYNFIRAQSFPYPGAFIRTIDGKKLVIEKSRIE